MKLNVDYCRHCPRPATKEKGFGHGPPRPDQCHYCMPKTFTDRLGAYVNIDVEIDSLAHKIKEAEEAIAYFSNLQNRHRMEIKQHGVEGKVRIIELCGVSVVLDWTEGFHISFARPERDPAK